MHDYSVKIIVSIRPTCFCLNFKQFIFGPHSMTILIILITLSANVAAQSKQAKLYMPVSKMFVALNQKLSELRKNNASSKKTFIKKSALTSSPRSEQSKLTTFLKGGSIMKTMIIEDVTVATTSNTNSSCGGADPGCGPSCSTDD